VQLLETNIEQHESKFTINGVNKLYLIAMVLFISVGSFVQSRSFNIGIIITEFILIALPPLLYVIIKRGSIKKELRFNRLHFIDALLVTLIFICGYPIAVFVNLIGNIFVSFFGKLITSPIPIANNINEYFLMLLIVAGSAGLCEEILFRGLILRGSERLGMWKSIIYTAVLFSMLHINIQNIFGPLFLGILLGYVVYVTNSIYAGMLGHFVNNAISVSITFLLMQLSLFNNITAQDLPAGAETLGLIVWAVIFGFVAILPSIILVLCMRKLKGLSKNRIQDVQIDTGKTEGMELQGVIKNPKVMWPIYISFAIFSFFSIVQVAYVITGKSIFDMMS